MYKYRKKPVVIEAIKFTGVNSEPRFLKPSPPWLSEALALPRDQEGAVWADIRVDLTLNIFTSEGIMKAQPGDYIIRGVKGELYPCKPDIFAATYERV